MVLTDRQRADLHRGIYEYLLARSASAGGGPSSEAFARAAVALHDADPLGCGGGSSSNGKTMINGEISPSKSSAASSATPLLEKKWVAIPRLQKRVMELERQVSQSAKIHAHRGSSQGDDGKASTGGRRMLPRHPYLHKLQGHSAVVTCVAVHPVFTLAASGSEDGTIKIWDHESGEFMKTLKGHTNTVNGLDFTPKGTHLASCSTDLSIKLWDMSSRNGQHQQYVCVRTLRGHDHTISAVRFLPLATGLSLLSEQRGLENHQQSAATSGGGVQASMAGCQHLLSASRDGTVKMWDVETGFCDHTVSDHSDWVRCLAVQGHAKSGESNSTVVWASSGNDTVIYVYEGRKSVLELRGHEHVVESLAFVTEEPLKTSPSTSRDSKHMDTVRDYLASGSRDRTIRLWKLSEATCLATFVAHENWVRSVLIHPSGNYIISASDDKTIRVFDISAQRCLRVLEKAHDHFVTSIAMHHTLPILVSGGVDQTVRCWQLD